MTTEAHREKSRGIVARCGICTVSDTRTFATDRGGVLIRDQLTQHGHHIASYDIVRDDAEEIRGWLQAGLDEQLDVLIFSGGTGISSRDRTPDVVGEFFEKELLGFGELFRLLSYEDIGAAAFLSRAVAGIRERTAMFCLPGSPAAVALAMDKLIAPELPHLLGELRK